MTKEIDYISIYNKYRKKTIEQIQAIIEDMKAEAEGYGERLQSEGFVTLDDSANNLKIAVLTQLLEEKTKSV